MRGRIVWFVLIFSINFSFGQYDYKSVLPNLDGQDLLQKLKDDYRPGSVLNYDDARDTLFKRVYGVNDSLSCVYTGHRLYLFPGTDPSQAVYLNGIANGINTEHTWPQSYGASIGNARSDMHHLYPTRLQVNSDRGNLPFMDIPDNQSSEWYYLTNEQSNVPGANIDLYSERSGSAFEPREDHKGNLARAIMYFRTIYSSEAQQAPANFFSSMQETLCLWHSQDPVDSLEWRRNKMIATYQSGKLNPFILDCTLPTRLFCPQVQVACDPTVSGISIPNPINFDIYPNPNRGSFTVRIPDQELEAATLFIYNAFGKIIAQYEVTANEENVNMNPNGNLAPGIYLVQLRTKNRVGSRRIILQQ